MLAYSRSLPRWALLILLVLFVACSSPVPPERPVVVAMPTGPHTFYPDRDLEEHSLWVLLNVFEGLLSREDDLSFVPALAESWENPDETTWIFRIREGVRLHDGRALNAQLVEAAYLQAMENPDSRSLAGEVLEVQAMGSRQIMIRTEGPTSADEFVAPIAFAPVSDSLLPVGTGPYRISRVDPGRAVHLDRFSEYWGEMPEPRRLEYRIVPSSNERVSALLNGDVDLVADISLADGQRLEESGAARFVASSGLRIISLGMRVVPKESKLGDPRIRRAVALAIDRQTLVSGALEGWAEVSDQLLTPVSTGFAENLEPFPYDPQESLRLLEEAGVPKGLELTIDYPEGKYRNIGGVASAVASNLRSVGIHAQTRSRTLDQILWEPDSRSPLWLLGWISVSDALITYDYLLHTPVHHRGQYNLAGYSDSGMDTLLDQAHGLRLEDRKRVSGQVARKLLQDLPILPLYRQDDFYAVSSYIDFNPGVSRSIQGVNITLRKVAN